MAEQGTVHTVDLLEEALAVAQQLGFEVRREWLNGKKSGVCRIGKRYLLFIDLSLTASEQLDQVLEPLRLVCEGEPSLVMSPHLRKLLIRLPKHTETHAHG